MSDYFRRISGISQASLKLLLHIFLSLCIYVSISTLYLFQTGQKLFDYVGKTSGVVRGGASEANITRIHRKNSPNPSKKAKKSVACTNTEL